MPTVGFMRWTGPQSSLCKAERGCDSPPMAKRFSDCGPNRIHNHAHARIGVRGDAELGLIRILFVQSPDCCNMPMVQCAAWSPMPRFLGPRSIDSDNAWQATTMTPAPSAKDDLPLSSQRAKSLVEAQAEGGEETRDQEDLRLAQDFLNSVWQGGAISRIPVQKPQPPASSQPDESDP